MAKAGKESTKLKIDKKIEKLKDYAKRNNKDLSDDNIKQIRKWEKSESYNEKCVKIGKQILFNLSSEVPEYDFIPFDLVPEKIKDIFNINLDETLLRLIVDEIIEKDGESWIQKRECIYFQE